MLIREFRQIRLHRITGRIRHLRHPPDSVQADHVNYEYVKCKSESGITCFVICICKRIIFFAATADFSALEGGTLHLNQLS